MCLTSGTVFGAMQPNLARKVSLHGTRKPQQCVACLFRCPAIASYKLILRTNGIGDFLTREPLTWNIHLGCPSRQDRARLNVMPHHSRQTLTVNYLSSLFIRLRPLRYGKSPESVWRNVVYASCASNASKFSAELFLWECSEKTTFRIQLSHMTR